MAGDFAGDEAEASVTRRRFLANLGRGAVAGGAAAKLLGLSRTGLYTKLAKYGME